jgi:hypothetical protein
MCGAAAETSTNLLEKFATRHLSKHGLKFYLCPCFGFDLAADNGEFTSESFYRKYCTACRGREGDRERMKVKVE